MDVPADWSDLNVEDYLVKLQEGQATLVRATRYFLKTNQWKRAADGREKRQEVTKWWSRGGTICPPQVSKQAPRQVIEAPRRLLQWIVLTSSKS